MRPSRSLLVFLLTAPLSTPATSLAQGTPSEADRAGIAALYTRVAAAARRAWETRDPSLLIPDSTLTVQTPQGRTLTAAQVRADLQQQKHA